MSLASPKSLNCLSAPHTTKTKNDTLTGFAGHSDYEESTCKAGDPGSVPGLGRAPGEGSSNLLQYSCLEKSMNRKA